MLISEHPDSTYVGCLSVAFFLSKKDIIFFALVLSLAVVFIDIVLSCYIPCFYSFLLYSLLLFFSCYIPYSWSLPYIYLTTVLSLLYSLLLYLSCYILCPCSFPVLFLILVLFLLYSLLLFFPCYIHYSCSFPVIVLILVLFCYISYSCYFVSIFLTLVHFLLYSLLLLFFVIFLTLVISLLYSLLLFYPCYIHYLFLFFSCYGPYTCSFLLYFILLLFCWYIPYSCSFPVIFLTLVLFLLYALLLFIIPFPSCLHMSSSFFVFFSCLIYVPCLMSCHRSLSIVSASFSYWRFFFPYFRHSAVHCFLFTFLLVTNWTCKNIV